MELKDQSHLGPMPQPVLSHAHGPPRGWKPSSVLDHKKADSLGGPGGEEDDPVQDRQDQLINDHPTTSLGPALPPLIILGPGCLRANRVL